jgi:hypothetical protein
VQRSEFRRRDQARPRSDEADLVGECDRLGAVAQSEPGQEMVHVRPDRRLTHRERHCDIRIRLAQGDEAEDLELARRKASHWQGRLRSARGKPAGDMPEEPAGDPRRDESLACRDRPRRTNELLGGAGREEQTAGACSDGFDNVVIVCAS